MHISSRALSTGLVTLLPLAAAVSPATSRCVRSSTRRAASCGDQAVLRSCIESLGDYFFQTDIEMCYLDAGCGPDEAAASAIELLTACAAADEPEQQVGDLRKRQGGGNSNNDDDEDSSGSGGSNNGNNSGNADEEDADADASPTRNQPAQATEEDETADPPQTPAPETEVKTETRPAATTAAPQTTRTNTGIDPSDCTSTTSITTEFCGIEDDKNVCSSTVIAKPTCKEGLLCRMDSSGITNCMKAENSLSTGGIIVSLVFSAAIVVSIALMTFFCCREKSEAKKLKAKMEAAAIAKASGAGRRNVSDRQPLMTQAHEGYGGGNGYDGGAPGEQNPFQDNNQRL